MIYQRSLKSAVAKVSGIPFATLAWMPYPQWAEIRSRYCISNRLREVGQ